MNKPLLAALAALVITGAGAAPAAAMQADMGAPVAKGAVAS